MNLYNLILNIFLKLAPLLSVFSPRIKQALLHRKPASSNYLFQSDNSKKRIWFHCSSYGEFEGILPLLKAYADKAEHTIIVSFFSPSGFKPLHTHPLIDYCFYLPFDTRGAMQRLFKTLQPNVLLVSQNEYWPNMIKESLQSGIPIYYISTYVRPNHWWLNKSLHFLTNPLRSVDKIFLQDKISLDLMARAAYQNVQLVGNSRVDQVIQNSKTTHEYPKIEDFASGASVLLGGSTLKADDKIILSAFVTMSGMKLILVPHDPSQFNAQCLPTQLQDDYCLLSRFTAGDQQKSVLIVDTLGDLKYLYRYAHIAFIGGGFDEGVHSVLEAAVFEIPILSGPNIDKFQDAVNLAKMGVLTCIESEGELRNEIAASKEGLSPILRENLQSYLTEHAGATQRMLDLIRF